MSSHKEYVLVKFKKDNTYSIIEDKSLKLVNKKKASIKFETGWSTGDIIYRGSKRKCEKKGEKIGTETSVTSDSEYEPHNNQKKTQKKIANSEGENVLDEISDVESDSNNSNQEQNMFRRLDSPKSIQVSSISDTTIAIIQQDIIEIKLGLKKQTRMLEKLMESSSNNKKKSNEYPTAIMYNGKNLLDSACTSMSRYITFLMQELFTIEERISGIIKIPGVPSNSKRRTLSPQRAEIFKNCVMTKARPAEDQKQKIWVDCVDKANRRCYDTKIDEQNN